jgi:hypothetical protein
MVSQGLCHHSSDRDIDRGTDHALARVPDPERDSVRIPRREPASDPSRSPLAERVWDHVDEGM